MLPSKIGEYIWWLSVLADRMDLDFCACVEKFLEQKLKELER